MNNIKNTIQAQIENNRIVLYMKGTADMPQCGFSALAIKLLRLCGVEEFLTIDVLTNANIRQGIKEFSDWPTIPQLYVDGTFIGGSDIMQEMYASGELQELLADK